MCGAKLLRARVRTRWVRVTGDLCCLPAACPWGRRDTEPPVGDSATARENLQRRAPQLDEADAVPYQVRSVDATELDRLHALRLECLLDSPASFGSTYASEVARDPKSRLPWVHEGVAVIAEDGSEWHGLATGTVANGVVHVFAMWVRPERRRKGIARTLLDAVLAWGVQRGATSARLGVVDDNAGAAELYRKEGFTPTGEREPLRSDEAHEVIYLARALA
jgi:ribosomal protein S18 acetylase RimI-like enzyme